MQKKIRDTYYKNFSNIDVNGVLTDELNQYGLIERINSEFDSNKEELSREDIDNTIRIILRLILWDKLFKGTEYAFDEGCFWGDKRRKDVVYLNRIVCVRPGEKIIYPNTAKILFSIFGRWPQMRESFFGGQKDSLMKCSSEQDYRAFIETKPYFEYALFALYHLCRLTNKSVKKFTTAINKSFEEDTTAIDLFSDSDIFRTLFQKINDIQFMWNGKASVSNEETIVIREFVIKLLAGFKAIPGKNGFFLHPKPIDVSFLNGVLAFLKDGDFSHDVSPLYYERYLHNTSSVKKETGAIISSINFFQSLLILLNSLVSGVCFIIPPSHLVSNYGSPKLEYLWATDDIDARKIVILRCSDGRLSNLSNNAYAGCFILLQEQQNR